MMDFDATSLYPSAMWDQTRVYPKKENGFAFKHRMNDIYIYIYVEAFNIQTFNQDGNESANLKKIYFNPPELIFQHLPVKEKVKNIEVIIVRIVFIIDTLIDVDIQEIVEIGGKVIEIYEAVIYTENFRIPPF